jgi:hypothetical protein
VFKPPPSTIHVPSYRLSFERAGQVAGLTGVWATEVPAECGGDGTAFLNMLVPAALDGQSIVSSTRMSKLGPPVELIVAVPTSGDANEFRLDQITDLYDVHLKDAYASESDVVLLVIAAPEDKRGKETFTTADGTDHELDANLAERHDYLVIFDRQGNYKRKIQIDDVIALHRFAEFASGTFLVFGFDRQDHSPKLAMFKDDGTLLKFLDITKGDAPKSMFGTLNGTGKGPAIYVAPAQLVPYGDSIIVVQNRSKFPLLEVSQGGAIRVIKTKLPGGAQIDALIPSDNNLYARVDGPRIRTIYELSERSGKILSRFQIGNNELGADLACVHEGEFLSFEQREGTLVRLVGTAEPAVAPASTDPKTQNSSSASSADKR